MFLTPSAPGCCCVLFCPPLHSKWHTLKCMSCLLFAQNVWVNPPCGDGSCDEPYEYPEYSRFGCRADCGILKNIQNLTRVRIAIRHDFSHPSVSVPSAVSGVRRVCSAGMQRAQVDSASLCPCKHHVHRKPPNLLKQRLPHHLPRLPILNSCMLQMHAY